MNKTNQLLTEIAKRKEGFSFSNVLSILKGKKELKLPKNATNDTASTNKLTPAPIRNEGITLDDLKEEIRLLAYSNWEKAGYPESDGNSFWVEAEQELFGPDPLKDGGYYVYIQRKNGSINLQLIK